MSKRNKTLELLRGLLAERQQYEQWLAALANKRADTPDSVYNRVHADYQSRLDIVLDHLQSHTQDLQTSMSELGAQLAEVTERQNTRNESRQEAELRAAVGEFSADKWTEISRDAEGELAKLGQERTGIESQLAELSGILELTQGRTSAANLLQPRDVPAASPAASIGQESRRPNTYAEAAAISQPPKAVELPPKLEEVRQNTPAPPPAEATATHAKANAGDKREEVKFPNWSDSDKNQATSNAAAPKSKTTPVPESQKTLKCSECGSLNFPTEWYCEKCGSELATL